MNSAEIVEAMAQAMYERGEEWSPSTREHYLRQADAALTALKALGMVVVPRVATEGMPMHVYTPAAGTPCCLVCGHMSGEACHFAQTKGQDHD